MNCTTIGSISLFFEFASIENEQKTLQQEKQTIYFHILS